MDIKNRNKIIVVSLCDSYTKKLAKKLSQGLDMIFCDSKDLVEYELIDKKNLKDFSSKQYLLESEKKVMEHIASFVNVVISMNYDYLCHNIELFKKNSMIIFLNHTKKFVKENGNAIDFISYDDRKDNLEKISDLTLNLKKTDVDFVINKIYNTLGGIL